MFRMTPQKAIWYGWLACWVFIALFVSYIGMEYVVVQVSQKDLPLRYITPVQSLIYCVLFLTFLNSVRAFAQLRKDESLEKTANTLLLVNVAEVILMIPYSFPDYMDPTFLVIVLAALIPLLCVNGIVLIRIADHFTAYVDEFGASAKRVTLWNRIAGWMLASVVLALPGVFVSLIGEFFLWRFLAKVIKQNYVATPVPVSAQTTV